MKLKYLLRSGSFKFMLDKEDKSHKVNTYQYNGKKIYYRSNTSDVSLIYEILLKKGFKSEYFIPHNVQAKVVVDVGANIGISAILFAKLFPKAQIYAFEPVTINYELLLKNIKNYSNVETYNFGLGTKNDFFDIFISHEGDWLNYGGASIIGDISGHGETHRCEVKNANQALEYIGVKDIDIIKIDTEGAEYDILTSIDKNILSKVKWIVGELHGNKDFKLLDYLTKLGFSIGVRKHIHNDIFMFYAGRKDIVDGMTRKEKKYLI